MIRNGMWDVFSLLEPRNKEKKCDLLIHKSRFSLDYVKRHVDSLQKSSKAYKYVFQNLMCSGVYPRNTLLNNILHKVLPLLPLKVTGTEVSVDTISTFLFNPYYTLGETLTHKKSLKLKSYPGENVTDFCAEILVYAERLESSGAFKPKHLDYIIYISEDTSDSRFRF